MDFSHPSVAEEFGNDRVTRWASRRATVVAGGQGDGDGLEQLSGPCDLLLEGGDRLRGLNGWLIG